ncbi:MAG: hypothetical protein ABIO05_02425, partial [Ferruginibacter sp.]
NPVFSSMIARDLFSPVQKFSVAPYSYVKDRGYAFEKKLAGNTNELLSIQMKDLVTAEWEAKIPLIIFNAVIKSDGRKLMVASQPISFMMKPVVYQQDTTVSADAVDFNALFYKQHPLNLRVLTALRMNATFPYVLPNVWLPSNPIIDVMDAGLRDNFGQETSLRFIENFDDWIKVNTGGIIILQIRDRVSDNWNNPFQTVSLTDMLVNPGTVLQHNWQKLQDYFQADQFNYFKNGKDSTIQRISIEYAPQEPKKSAALNFHLTTREKRDIKRSLQNPVNVFAMKKIADLLAH